MEKVTFVQFEGERGNDLVMIGDFKYDSRKQKY